MTDALLLEKIDAFLTQHKENMLEDLAELVAIPSTEGEAQPGAPFGAEPRRALDAALAMARRFGMRTYDGQGYVGWGELKGEQTEHIATVTHLDVVPAGEGWAGSAFRLRRENSWLFGRGVVDDKGPGILCLYAAKFLVDNNIPLRYGLRVLLGCSEEQGMEDLEYYLARNPQPLFAFSPDAEFPLCNGEKGVYGGEFTAQLPPGNLLAFSVGSATNVIPERAHCTLKKPATLPKAAGGVTVHVQGDTLRLEARGIGGHAAMPAGTRNAIGMLVEYLLENGLCTEAENRALQLLWQLHKASDGSGLGIACRDDLFEPLTCNGGVIRFENGVLTQSIDIRYPMATDDRALTEALGDLAAEYGAAFRCLRADKPFYIPPNTPAIAALLECYEKVTGKEGKPFTIGGGTYARHFDNAVSFGPEHRNEPKPDFAGPIHGPDEAISEADFFEAFKIYVLALVRLQQLELRY